MASRHVKNAAPCVMGGGGSDHSKGPPATTLGTAGVEVHPAVAGLAAPANAEGHHVTVVPSSEYTHRKAELRSTRKFVSRGFQFSYSVMSNSLQPCGLQHARLPCPSPIPRAYSNSCPSNWWCHPTISSSIIPFSSCLQSFPASGSFQMSQFFASGS